LTALALPSDHWRVRTEQEQARRWITALSATSSHSRSASRYTRSRELLRRLLKEHAPDDAHQQLAGRMIEHLEQSGFEIDEAEQVMRKRPPNRHHG
jgi:hypothetical protein